MSLKNQIETVLKNNPSYDYRRIDLALMANHKRTFGVMMVIWHQMPYRRRDRKFRKTKNSTVALMNAVEKHGRPRILHSDQGSEYTSKIYRSFADNLGIRLLMNKKASL